MKLLKEYIYPRLILDLITFFIPLMFLGVISTSLSIFSIEVWFGIFANYLMLIFAFIYNDVEDAEADSKYTFKKLSFLKHMKMNLGIYEQKKGNRRFQNPFSNGMLTKKNGYIILLIIALISLIFSFFSGFFVFFVAISNLIIGILYSGGMFQLKALPIIDILSHSYLLAGAQILYFMFYKNAAINNLTLIVLFAAISYSIGGDLWNEYRDFDSDQEAGLKNTASFLGKKWTLILNKSLSYLSLMILILSIGYFFIK